MSRRLATLRAEIDPLRRFVDSLWGQLDRLRAQTDTRFGQVCKEIDALGDAGAGGGGVWGERVAAIHSS